MLITNKFKLLFIQHLRGEGFRTLTVDVKFLTKENASIIQVNLFQKVKNEKIHTSCLLVSTLQVPYTLILEILRKRFKLPRMKL